MIVVRLLWLAVLVLVLPVCVGNCFAGVDKPHKNIVFLWISGQILLWAGFQVICVPVILTEGRLEKVVLWYGVYITGLLVVSAVLWFRNHKGPKAVWTQKPDRGSGHIVGDLWSAFITSAGTGGGYGLQ